MAPFRTYSDAAWIMKAVCRSQRRAAEFREMASMTRDPLLRRQMCVSAASALIHSRFERGVPTPKGHRLTRMIVGPAFDRIEEMAS